MGALANLPSLLLLHGALGSREQRFALANLLGDIRDTHCIDFSGHGDAPLASERIRDEGFSTLVTAYMDTNTIASTDIFGYSLGGYVACLAAHRIPAGCVPSSCW